MDADNLRRPGLWLPLLAVACALLAGCARDTYPNLAIRPEERATGSFAAPAAPAPSAVAEAPAAGDLAARLDTLVARAQAANRAFEQARGPAEALVSAAAGAAPASDPWSRANQALGRLTAAHGPTGAALTAIEQISDDDRITHAIADGNAGSSAGSSLARADGAAINAAYEQVLAMANEQQAVLAALSGRLAQ